MGVIVWLTIFTGVSVALLFWLMGIVGLQMFRPQRTPKLDKTLPWWLHRWSPILHVLAVYVAPWISRNQRKQWEMRFDEAGMRHLLQPEYMVALQVTIMVVTWAVFIFLQITIQWSFSTWVTLLLLGSVLGWWWPRWWLREQIKQRKLRIVRALPFMLDMLTLCVEAGLNIQAALITSVQRGPDSPLRDELQKALIDIRTGIPRAQALRQMAYRINEPTIRTWVASLIQAESLGMSLVVMLRTQSDQRRSERFMLAEKKAMEAPVKMLLPLASCIFPCTFIILGFPIVVKLLTSPW